MSRHDIPNPFEVFTLFFGFLYFFLMFVIPLTVVDFVLWFIYHVMTSPAVNKLLGY